MDDSYDFSPPGRIARVRFTPAADVLRWQWTGRLDPRAAIADSGLPAPIPGLVDRVVRRTRLWRRERLDVARELCAHFADGLASGRPAEDLVREFGPPKVAARLIRKAKLRNRPVVWQCWRIFLRTILVLFAIVCAVYAFLAVRFYLGQPSIAHNYWNEINESRRVSEADRAWPLYREALLKLGQKDAGWLYPEKLADGPEGKHWNEAVALLERRKDSIELTRRGAKRSHFGYYLGDPADAAAGKDATANWLITPNLPIAEDNRDLRSALLIGPQYSRTLARLLIVDARIAAAADERDRVMADLTALIALAEQLFLPKPTLVEQLIGMAIFGMATDTSGRILAEHAAVLSDSQWTELAHRLSAFRQGNFEIDFSGERLLFDDVMQRVYTDNGQGDGRITHAGIGLMNSYSTSRNDILDICNPNRQDSVVAFSGRILSPGVAAFVGSREENQRLYDSMLDEMIAAHQGPAWQWDRRIIDGIEKRLSETSSIPTNRFRYYFVRLILPGVDAMFNAGERPVQLRDAAEVAIALELWHRRHGGWPETLAELVPDLLPAVPPDRVDGKPLRYIVREDRPVLYSIGADRRDNHGVPCPNPEDAMEFNYGVVDTTTPSRAPPPGDWILFPPAKEKIEDD